MKTSSEKKSKKAVFFDRDGVLNKKASEHDYVKKHEEFFWINGVKELIKKINDLGFLVVVISNQRGIARGLVTSGFVDELHARMNRDLEEIDAHIDGFYYCPHDHEDKCLCRKPKSGMFLTAAKELDINLSESFAVGDSVTDTEAALLVDCTPIFVLTDKLDTKLVMGSILK
ncbi:MAG: HAD family hydrolase [Candidatus Taylorbacteria bacterium]|nr:HAD family hydrolase [Candidatus Taylorbacteria bacterium]